MRSTGKYILNTSQTFPISNAVSGIECARITLFLPFTSLNSWLGRYSSRTLLLFISRKRNTIGSDADKEHTSLEEPVNYREKSFPLSNHGAITFYISAEYW
jgi:hypothetical protein